ncbi:MAG TPA: SDR family NAD(P)-dependent oxidoreductase [Candidatus Dormibacteraeota bacterium]|nr:SDR family NAD(P)-dependent oxidoreductase [Candidatus Dormibacteraeota bacterium]
MAEPPSLEGRRILVTGSSAGIGEAIALQAVEAGAQVAGLARRVSDGFANGIHSFRCDVRDEESVERTIDRAAEALGGHLDGIVANAGYGLYGLITKGKPKDWHDVVETNVMGVLYTVFYGYRRMAPEGVRDILLMSSISGRGSRLGAGVYAATKFAVTAIGESLRQELADEHVRVTLVEPATVDTPFYDVAVRHEGAGVIPRKFDPLTAGDVAAACINAMAQPANSVISVIQMRPNGQAT